MKKSSDFTQIDDAIKTSKNHSQTPLDQIIESARKRELVIVIGAGVSTALSDRTAPTWTGLIDNGLQHSLKKGLITAPQHKNWQAMLQSADLDELLSAAEFMSRKLGASIGDLYTRWFQDLFRSIKATNKEMADSIKEIYSANIPICTLNYDGLLEEVTKLPTILMSNTTYVTEWMRGERKGILHLHGSWEEPDSCILSIRDYQTTIGNEVRDLVQRSLGSFKRLLFIGCGATLSDPNFSALISWLRKHMPAVTLQHYALVKESDVALRHMDETWQGFVEPLSFGKEFNDLPKYLKESFSSIKNFPSHSLIATKAPNENDVLEAYRRFLIKDCGQMTIEGIKADMDTAKQKFDIERLFVPLNVSLCPPEYPVNDPKREIKLAAWLKKNKESTPFGLALRNHRRLALLALPGGGKTMLLKRVAVAYAETNRRSATDDFLPEQDFFPVMIRCREWREHIQSPILTLLKKLPEITGQINLTGFVDALIPLFKAGKILLLVDGLDEIHNDADRSTFVEHLENFLEDHESVHLVITSREAGFNLVAPCLNRFCVKFRVAPLTAKTITHLCHFWHILMTGESPESLAEAKVLSSHIIETRALHRLAENPLLLTMLLVVKHGAGRLPPDRVSLYARAAEVLLDTWNIKGHDALNMKEALPQLACVAFELMRQGKQTATENELLDLLTNARDKLPQIGRYAKDSPYEFLKRVELRSSLLLEAGHQLENGSTVPFYQFRHLTFQEYLAAVAAANGHYLGYQTNDNVLNPLRPFILAEEWKEVIPMAAVLVGKQAEPLIGALVSEGRTLKRKLYAHKNFKGKREWCDFPPKLPPPIARLTQCLIEEAEASQAILPEALQLIALFGRGCNSEDDWRSLARGPYAVELLHQAWKLYEPGNTPNETWIRNTCAVLGSHRYSELYWKSKEGKKVLMQLITSDVHENIAIGLLSTVEILSYSRQEQAQVSLPIPLKEIEKKIFCDYHPIWHAAAWLWALIHHYQKKKRIPDSIILDRLLELWTREERNNYNEKILDFAITEIGGLQRDSWVPNLTKEQQEFVIKNLNLPDPEKSGLYGAQIAACIIAFHAKNIISDAKLAPIILKSYSAEPQFGGIQMLTQMGPIAEKQLTELKKLKKSHDLL